MHPFKQVQAKHQQVQLSFLLFLVARVEYHKSSSLPHSGTASRESAGLLRRGCEFDSPRLRRDHFFFQISSNLVFEGKIPNVYHISNTPVHSNSGALFLNTFLEFVKLSPDHVVKIQNNLTFFQQSKRMRITLPVWEFVNCNCQWRLRASWLKHTNGLRNEAPTYKQTARLRND